MLHPDPTTRPVLMHVGTLQLPFKVRQQADSAPRLVSHMRMNACGQGAATMLTSFSARYIASL